jgi:chorismate mutase/prephenate dehydratase
MSNDKKLDSLRDRIDAVDAQLQELINRRAALAREVAEVKTGQGETADFYRPDREADVLRRISERNSGPLPAEEMVRLFREVMSACLALEKPLTVAYLGPAGTFTQAAALKHFGHSIRTLAMDTIDAVFREVEAGAADYGVVPIENSTEGVVSHTLDMFQNSSLHICGEVAQRIHHHLMSRDGSRGAIDRVLAHQQALAQCRGWLDDNLPGVEHVAVVSNAEAARIVREESGSAAIASEMAAELYELTILERNIEDEPDNTTRFLVIGDRLVEASGDDKTSILISVRNKPGALYAMLKPIAEHGISMTRIESRPSRQAIWEYVFYIDLDGHRDSDNVAAALAELSAETFAVKVLGSYPKAVL